MAARSPGGRGEDKPRDDPERNERCGRPKVTRSLGARPGSCSHRSTSRCALTPDVIRTVPANLLVTDRGSCEALALSAREWEWNWHQFGPRGHEHPQNTWVDGIVEHGEFTPLCCQEYGLFGVWRASGPHSDRRVGDTVMLAWRVRMTPVDIMKLTGGI